MDRYEVFPDGDKWSHRRRTEEGAAKDRGETRETRSEAIADARAARDRESVVLLRPDGSVYGELDHEIRDDGGSREVQLEPAGELSEV